jgi:hypothetical protein
MRRHRIGERHRIELRRRAPLSSKPSDAGDDGDAAANDDDVPPTYVRAIADYDAAADDGDVHARRCWHVVIVLRLCRVEFTYWRSCTRVVRWCSARLVAGERALPPSDSALVRCV